MMAMLWRWLRKNLNLVLLLSAATCLALALGRLVRGATWSLMVPVSFAAVGCGWGLASGRLTARQAWAGLTALGIPGVFGYVAGLAAPFGRLLLALLALVPQLIAWMSEGTLPDFELFYPAWSALAGHASNALVRFWTWSLALFSGEPVTDPLAVALAWNLLLWLVGAWSGWQLRRNGQALGALLPGGVLLAVVVDYTRGETSLVLVYLAILLALMGAARNRWRQAGWERRKLDYSESVVFETMLMVGLLTTGLVLSAAGAPSLSWRALLDRLRGSDRAGVDQVAESLGLEAPPNAANRPAYRSGGLPRQHLLDLPPEQLQELVLVVSTGEYPPMPAGAAEISPERYYWRAITYDVYTGAGWSSSPAREVEYPPNVSFLEQPADYRLLRQRIKRVAGQGTSLYWAGLLAQAETGLQIAWRTEPPADPVPASNGDMLGALADPDEFTVISYLPQIGADRLRAAGGEVPEAIRRRYLRLPDSVPERVLGLAREVTQAALSPYDRALAIESYLRGFPYTLEVAPPPSGRDVVDYFLFTARQGYCDYYASAMVVLARAVGLPARIVIGYAGGEYNAQSAEYILRAENAHSWVEVYFSGYGWVEFEPTAGLPPLDRTSSGSAAGPAPGLPPAGQAFAWLKTAWRGLAASLAGQALIVGLGLVGLFLVWQAGEVGYLYLLPAPGAVGRMYSRLDRASARLLPHLPAGRTPHQLGAALVQALGVSQDRMLARLFAPAEREIERVVALYVAQAFSPHPPASYRVRRGIQAWSRLRWRLWLANRIQPPAGRKSRR